jgi:hypothetical protein
MGYQPTFSTPGREYILFAGAIDAARVNPVRTFSQSPSIWWPGDRAWCVVNEIDLDSTYIGCSEACRDDLLAHSELEAYEIDPACGIDWLSDHLNQL